MAALIVFESEAPAVFPPDRPRKRERIGEQRLIDTVFLSVCDGEQNWLFNIFSVAGFRVLNSYVFRLHLIGGRGIFQCDGAMLAGFHAKGGDLSRIGRPGDSAEIVVISFRTVEAERFGIFGAFCAKK